MDTPIPTAAPHDDPTASSKHNDFTAFGLSCVVLFVSVILFIMLRKWIVVQRIQENAKQSRQEDLSKKKNIEEMLQAATFKWRRGREPDDTLECAICMEAFRPGDLVCRPVDGDCRHPLHVVCVSSWLVKTDACPICRRPYLMGQEAMEENV